MRAQRFVVMLLVVMGLGGVALMNAAYAAGNLYRWVDAQGRLHYGDQPHDDAKRLDLHIPGAGTVTQPPPAPLVDSTACKNERAQLANYREAGSIAETDSRGETHVLTAAEQQELIDLTQDKVNKVCEAGTASSAASISSDDGLSQ